MEAAKALKVGFASVFGAYLAYKAYPVMYEWEMLPFVKTEAYKAKEALMDYSKLDGIVYDAYDKGSQPPRSEMLPTSRGQMIIK
jgi:hypothetical protein